MPLSSAWNESRNHSRPFAIAALALLGIHIAWLLLLPQPVVGSNVLQVLFPLLVVGMAVYQGASNPSPTARRCWLALAAAFLIWTVAQGLFLYFLYAPPKTHLPVRPDDILWLLFGMPLLLMLNTTEQEADHVAWLDRAQTLLFFVVVYLLVFVPAKRLAVSKAYLIQNVALILCCLCRLPICQVARERRFFIRLAVFLFNYTLFESFGELLYRHGWGVGSLADLVWTVPTAVLVLMTSLDLRREDQDTKGTRLLGIPTSALQGLSIALMTALSMGVSALLASRSTILGGAFMIAVFALFTMRTNAREHLWHQAHGRLKQTLLLDPLTGLGNRLQLSRSLAAQLQASSKAERTVLFFVDLDRFKQVNDSLGHALGDQLLIEVGRRLTAASGSGSTVCRLGGDEFVVLTSAASVDEAQANGEALLGALHLPVQLGNHQYRCSASIGVVMADVGDDPEDLLRTSDHAMYRAKQMGRDRIQVFDAGLRADLNTRRNMEAELRKAVEADEIQVAFQPIYSVEKNGFCGFEALARWQHASLGNVPPSDFISVAEESGLIYQLGAQVLEKACAQTAKWNNAWNTSLSVSVNVSPRQFTDPNLIPQLLVILDRTGLPTSLLRLEITETALLLHDGNVKHTLAQARSHGIRISLDDFGTGYSSLSFLLSLPVDEVKVDRSFVSHMYRDPDREELVRTVVHLGHSLGKRVVAEGVETEQDLLDLAGMGCECVQGYLISKPLSVSALEAELPALLSRVQARPPVILAAPQRKARLREADEVYRRGMPVDAVL